MKLPGHCILKLSVLALGVILLCGFNNPFKREKKTPADAAPPKWQVIEDNGKYDLIFLGKPVKSARINKGGISDAIENIQDLKELTTNVYFQIEKIEKGRLPKVISPPESKSKQFRDALDDKDFKKVLLSDYDMQEKQYDRQRFRIAVADPVTAFGFMFWDVFDREKTYKLYFKKYRNQDTYVMLKSELLSSV